MKTKLKINQFLLLAFAFGLQVYSQAPNHFSSKRV